MTESSTDTSPSHEEPRVGARELLAELARGVLHIITVEDDVDAVRLVHDQARCRDRGGESGKHSLDLLPKVSIMTVVNGDHAHGAFLRYTEVLGEEVLVVAAGEKERDEALALAAPQILLDLEEQ